MGETVSGIGAEGDRRRPLDDRSYLAVDLATSEMGAIKLEPIKAVTGKAGKPVSTMASARNSTFSRRAPAPTNASSTSLRAAFRFQNNIGHFMQPLNVPRRLDSPTRHQGYSRPSWLKNLPESPGPRLAITRLIALTLTLAVSGALDRPYLF